MIHKDHLFLHSVLNFLSHNQYKERIYTNPFPWSSLYVCHSKIIELFRKGVTEGRMIRNKFPSLLKIIVKYIDFKLSRFHLCSPNVRETKILELWDILKWWCCLNQLICFAYLDKGKSIICKSTLTYCSTSSGQCIGVMKTGLLCESELESRAVHEAFIRFSDPQFKIYSTYSHPMGEGQSRTQQAHPFE